jgi:hypothetical protein
LVETSPASAPRQVPFVTSHQNRPVPVVTSVIPVVGGAGGFGTFAGPAIGSFQEMFDAGDDFEPLRMAITGTVSPTSWEEVGGPGAAHEFQNGAKLLAVSQTAQVHLEIEQLLAQLRAAKAQEVAPAKKALSADEQKKAFEAAENEVMLMTVWLTPYDKKKDVDAKALAALVTELIEPKSWKTDDFALIRPLAGRLVIRHRRGVLRQIDAFLTTQWFTPHWIKQGESPTGSPAF